MKNVKAGPIQKWDHASGFACLNLFNTTHFHFEKQLTILQTKLIRLRHLSTVPDSHWFPLITISRLLKHAGVVDSITVNSKAALISVKVTVSL